MMEIDLNCDMGESFGAYTLGLDEEAMPLVSSANVACGFHASDPHTMRRTVQLAKRHGVAVGAHPSYPDLVGFGRPYVANPDLTERLQQRAVVEFTDDARTNADLFEPLYQART